MIWSGEKECWRHPGKNLQKSDSGSKSGSSARNFAAADGSVCGELISQRVAFLRQKLLSSDI